MSYMTNPNSRPSNYPLATLNSRYESSVDDATPLTESDSGEPPKPPRRRPPTGGELEPTEPGEKIVNVMEELVQEEAIAQLVEIEATSAGIQKLGDIVAYVLNRVPPLYATTKEGAEYQQQRARDELQQLISQQVTEAIAWIDRS
jgi:hypothetical protein